MASYLNHETFLEYKGNYIKKLGRFSSQASDEIAMEAYNVLDNTNNERLTYTLAYIDARFASTQTNINNVKTGVAAATFSPLTLAPAAGGSATTSLSVLGKDGSEAGSKLTVTLPTADTIVTSATSYTNTKNTVADLVTKMNTVQGTDTVEGSIKKGDKDTLTSANNYTNTQITTLKNKIGDVYQIKGSKTLAEFKAITSFVKGDVYNITEEFLIGGRKYPAYTNVVSLVDKSAAMTFNASTGFTDTEVDALGGVQDLSNYSTLANTVKSVSWTAASTGAPVSSSTAGTRGTLTFTMADGKTTSTVTVTSKDGPDAIKRSELSTASGIQVASNTLSLIGIADASGAALSKGVILNTKAPSMSVAQASNGITVGINGDGDVFSRTISNGAAATIPVGSASAFGVVKTDSSILNNAGTLSLPKNEMKCSDYLSITTVSPNAGKGVDFTFDIVADKITDIGNITSSLKTTTIAPVMKIPVGEAAISATLGIPLENEYNQTYVKIQMYTKNSAGAKLPATGQEGGWYLGVNDTALVTKINELSQKITNNQSGLEARVSALETLLSLA